MALCTWGLYLGGAAVDEEFDASNVAAVVGGKEDDCLGDLVWSAEPSHGDDVADTGQALSSDFVAVVEIVQAVGVGGTGADDVDANVASLQFRGPGAGEGADGGLGCGVDAIGGNAFDADDGGVEDDAGSVRKEWQGLLYREEEAFYIAVEHAVEELFVDSVEVSVLEAAGVGEDDVEASFFFFDLREEAVKVFQAGYVTLYGRDVGADLFDGRVQLGLIASGDEDVGAFADETFGSGQAYAAVASGDECDFAF